MTRRLAVAGVWVGALGAAAVALRWTGRGLLAAPPLTEPHRWAAWLDRRDPIVAAFSLLRLVAVAALWYLVVVTAIGVAARLIGAASVVRLADRFTVAPVRRVLAGSISLGMAASGLVAVAAPALRAPVAAHQAAPPPTTGPTTTGPTTTGPTTTGPTTTGPTTTGPPSTVTMHLLGPSEPVPSLPVPQASPATVERWAVNPGECFWSIAESVLSERWGRAPSDAEIVPYWRRLIEANRLELADRTDPDLIFPGQVFVVPPP